MSVGRRGRQVPAVSWATASLVLLLLPCVVAASEANAAGQPLMTPTAAASPSHTWYYEQPSNPVGLLVMLHRCGRNAEDFWPPSSACPQCIGMPEAVSISRQALARGYALLAINSYNRTLGSLGRCFSWGDDVVAVRDIVTGYRQRNGLERLPLFFTGCSSGGSLALRIAGFMAVDGIMPVAIGLKLEAFPPTQLAQLYQYPPVAYIDFASDIGMSTLVSGMVDFSEGAGLPTGRVSVTPSAITPDFFSRRDPLISPGLSQRLHQVLAQDMALLDANNFLKDGWSDNSSAADMQRVLAAAIDAYANSSAAAGVAEYSLAAPQPPFLSASADVLAEHVLEEMGVAWAEHINLGDYTTAALLWLERCGRDNFSAVVQRRKVTDPAALSPARAVAAEEVMAAWGACKPGAAQPPGREQTDSSGAGAGAPPPPSSATTPGRRGVVVLALAALAGWLA